MEVKQRIKKSLSVLVLILLIIISPLLFYLLDKGLHYFVSLIVAVCGIGSLLLSYENRKPSTREIVVLAAMCGVAVAARGLFAFTPFIKPFGAIVIITGIAFGGQSGFVCGSIGMLISNFFFGQGSWTAWQMVAYGISGLLAGILFYKQKNKNLALIVIYGGIVMLIVVGPILDFSTYLLYAQQGSKNAILPILLAGLPVNAIQSGATMAFLLILGRPLLKKMERIKIKYNIMNE